MNWFLLYKQHLYLQSDKVSEVTVKNYLSDLQKFFTWIEQTHKQPFSPDMLTEALIQVLC